MTQLLKELDLFWNRLNSAAISSDFVKGVQNLPELFLPYNQPRSDQQLWDDLPSQWPDRVNDCGRHGYTISETLIGLLLYLSIRIPIHCIWEMLLAYNRFIQWIGFSHIIGQEDSDEASSNNDFNISFLILKGIIMTFLALIDLLYAIILMSYLPSLIYLMTRYTVTRNYFKVSSPYKKNGKIDRHLVIEIKTRSLADSIGHIKKTFLECIRFAAHPPTVIQLVNQKNSIVLPEVERLLRQKDDSEEKIIYQLQKEQQKIPTDLFHHIQIAEWLYDDQLLDANTLISKHQVLFQWANGSDSQLVVKNKPLNNETVNGTTTKDFIKTIYEGINLVRLKDQINLPDGCYMQSTSV